MAELQNVPTPKQIQRHACLCKICNLPPEIRFDVNQMISENKTDGEIVKFCRELGHYISVDSVYSHRKYFKYVCDEEIVKRMIEDAKAQNPLYEEYMNERQQELMTMYEEVQEAKNALLKDLWVDTLPSVKDLVKKGQDNPMLPVKDYAQAFDILVKDALLLEGKPTGRLFVEQQGNMTSNGKMEISGLNKLCMMVGVDIDDESENEGKSDSEESN
jgi:hypothetical protein